MIKLKELKTSHFSVQCNKALIKLSFPWICRTARSMNRNYLSSSCTLITAEDVYYFSKGYDPLRQNDKYGYIISMLWYCTVREDISIYRYYLPVPKCDISM